jgi:hypothetical protein
MVVDRGDLEVLPTTSRSEQERHDGTAA